MQEIFNSDVQEERLAGLQERQGREMVLKIKQWERKIERRKKNRRKSRGRFVCVQVGWWVCRDMSVG